MEINKLKYRETVELINQRAGARGKIPNNIIYQFNQEKRGKAQMYKIRSEEKK